MRGNVRYRKKKSSWHDVPALASKPSKVRSKVRVKKVVKGKPKEVDQTLVDLLDI